jgi:hypothetical protein
VVEFIEADGLLLLLDLMAAMDYRVRQTREHLSVVRYLVPAPALLPHRLRALKGHCLEGRMQATSFCVEIVLRDPSPPLT